jgi:hypothetical protein
MSRHEQSSRLSLRHLVSLAIGYRLLAIGYWLLAIGYSSEPKAS